MDWTFNVPIKFYEYTIDELKERLKQYSHKNNVVFIASRRLIEAYNLKDILENYDESLVIFDESLTSLDTHLICDYFKRITGKPDVIIAVGGGSSIDFAKTISALYSFSDEGRISVDTVVDVITSKKYLDNNNSIPIIASSTTAGTGSDCTK